MMNAAQAQAFCNDVVKAYCDYCGHDADNNRLARIIGRELLRHGIINVPYSMFCVHPAECAGRGWCPRDPTCAD